MSDLDQALVDVTNLLEEQGISYMVIGGFANLVWGEPRSTFDIDITVDLSGTTVEAFLAAISTLGNAIPASPAQFANDNRVLPIRTRSGIAVDFVLATLAFEMDAIARARPISWAGKQVLVCTPEDLVIHKIVSERPRDHEDIVGTLRRQGRALDLARLDRLIEGLATDLADPAISERYLLAKRLSGLPTS